MEMLKPRLESRRLKASELSDLSMEVAWNTRVMLNAVLTLELLREAKGDAWWQQDEYVQERGLDELVLDPLRKNIVREIFDRHRLEKRYLLFGVSISSEAQQFYDSMFNLVGGRRFLADFYDELRSLVRRGESWIYVIGKKQYKEHMKYKKQRHEDRKKLREDIERIDRRHEESS
jgi:hypothetical protein